VHAFFHNWGFSSMFLAVFHGILYPFESMALDVSPSCRVQQSSLSGTTMDFVCPRLSSFGTALKSWALFRNKDVSSSRLVMYKARPNPQNLVFKIIQTIVLITFARLHDFLICVDHVSPAYLGLKII